MSETRTSDVHVLRMSASPNETTAWLESKGFRGAIASAPGVYSAGVVFDHGPGTPVQMGMMGDVLSYDAAEDAITVR